MTTKNQLQEILSNQKNPEILQKVLDDAWLNIYLDESKLWNPLLDIPDSMKNKEELYITYLMSRPEYLSFFCREILNIDLLPTQALILKEMWSRKFPMLIGSRGLGKSWLLSLYCMLRMIFMPGRKVVVCGAAFRQSKVLFDYMCSMWDNSPLLRSMVGESGNGPKKETDMYSFIIGKSITKALPIGDGQKIRGQRANDIISDEFATLPKDIFENVIAGFASVRSAPVKMVKEYAKEYLINKYNIPTNRREKDVEFDKDNQIVISGTAYYDFNHFADYWKKWHKIISSCGDKRILSELFDGNDEDFENFDWTQYSVMRIPYDLVPKGFMDEDQVARLKATVHSGIYLMEMGSCFCKDSMGFFKRSLIDSCVVSDLEGKEIDLGNGPILFQAVTKGRSDKKYIFGIDTAAERDNFAIVILEIHEDHRRVVYCWTTNKKDHREKLKTGTTEEKDYYSYCVRKIRDLMKIFPCEYLSIDSQGGGGGIIEGLHDSNKLEEGEFLIWPIPSEDPNKATDEDKQEGLHIIDVVHFANADWCAEANNGLRKDFEDKVCLFPKFDPVTISLSFEDDQQNNRMFDTLEDCVLDIEELKNELSMIVMNRTTSGRDRWDTPEVKLPGRRKGNLKKDRYSALIMANTTARRRMRALPDVDYTTHGGFSTSSKSDKEKPKFTGPTQITDKLSQLYDSL